MFQRAAQSQRLRQLGVRGIAQQQLAAPGDHGCVGLSETELREDLLHLRIGLQVEPGEQHPILGEEIADAKSVLGVARTNHPQAGEFP